MIIFAKIFHSGSKKYKANGKNREQTQNNKKKNKKQQHHQQTSSTTKTRTTATTKITTRRTNNKHQQQQRPTHPQQPTKETICDGHNKAIVCNTDMYIHPT